MNSRRNLFREMFAIRHARQTRFQADSEIRPVNDGQLHHLLKLPAPDRIVTSPYLRTRQTAERIADFLDFQGVIEVEPRIGEFADHPLESSTLEFEGIRIPGAYSRSSLVRDEAYSKWTQRLSEGWESLQEEPGVTWIVTHSLVLKWIDESIHGAPRYARAREYPHLSVMSEEGKFTVA